MIDSGFFVSFICCNTFSALVFVNCASTNITSCAPSIIVEFVQNWSSGDVNTLIENASWSFANDGRATTNVNPKNTKPYFKALIFILSPLLTKLTALRALCQDDRLKCPSEGTRRQLE